MPELTVRDVEPGDLERLVAINNDAVPAMNELDLHAMRHFAETSPWFRVALADGAVAGFLIVLRHDAVYDSANFRWFQARYPEFVYVDRIAVAPEARRLGVARRLYEELEGFARALGSARICAEVNLEPPNPVSLDFHRRSGFQEIGQLDHPEQGKRVVMLVKRMAS